MYRSGIKQLQEISFTHFQNDISGFENAYLANNEEAHGAATLHLFPRRIDLIAGVRS